MLGVEVIGLPDRIGLGPVSWPELHVFVHLQSAPAGRTIEPAENECLRSVRVSELRDTLARLMLDVQVAVPQKQSLCTR